MADEFDVSCPKCSATFTVTRDLCGEMAECADCETVFEIPFPEEATVLQSTETGAIKGTAAAPEAVEATNTVKLSRTGIGMIPRLKDSFEFGTKAPPGAQQSKVAPATKPNIPPGPAQPSLQQKPIAPPPPAAPPQAPGKSGVTFKKPTVPPPPPPAAPPPPQVHAQPQPAFNPTQTQSAGIPAKTPVQIPSWAKIVIHKDEEVYSCAESSSNPIQNVILVTLPVLICIILPVLPSPLSYIVGLLIAIITFVVAFIMIKKSSKTLVVLTSQRAISISGKTKVEAKR